MARLFEFSVYIILLHSVWAQRNLKRSPSPDAITFPNSGTLSRFGNNEVKPIKVPEHCKNQDYCTEMPEDYPQKVFSTLFKGYGMQGNVQPRLVFLENEFPDRESNSEAIDNCDSAVEYQPLYLIRNKRKVWNYVVQAMSENYVQEVRTEVCLKKDASCFTKIDPDPMFYTTFCEQKYTTWEFLIWDQAENRTRRDSADLPTCCACRYKHKN